MCPLCGWKNRNWEAKQSSQDHTVDKWQDEDLKPDLSDDKASGLQICNMTMGSSVFSEKQSIEADLSFAIASSVQYRLVFACLPRDKWKPYNRKTS